ncbi:MAG: 4Fe-4S dicluster domain-containing protein [Syntrophales bacterium]|jgi:epoxyqueuosine reductase QueG|nr:4Fe-4S dicluster domain-containing protein [Syntrophales bacterium]MDY0045171.1 4Fe-4S double cluster binding domain-containing protein [Syntrophales bacterium]
MTEQEIIDYAIQRGADLAGFASVDWWNREEHAPEEYRPRAIWPQTRSVIVLGMGMPLPIVETTPSVQHRDLYNACNRSLDDIAFDLARWLGRKGHAAVPIGRDGYANIHVLLKNPRAAFSHNLAAYYAGLGYIGINNTVLTRKLGPRVRFVSILTDAVLSGTGPMNEPLCIRCGACSSFCPADALPITREELRDPAVPVAEYDRTACTLWARELTRRGCYPCGICIKVCPVGDDRKIFGREKAIGHYRKELETPIVNAPDPLHRSWMHIRRHGSSLFDETAGPQDRFGDILRRIRKKSEEEKK